MSDIICVASDHAGFELKEFLYGELKKSGYELINLGTFSSESVDYPVYANKLCDYILSGKSSRGILVCGTGIGMSIMANRHKGIRAALAPTVECAELARMHNDANVLCLGARTTERSLALEAAKTFLSTEFSAGRHQNRVEMFDK